MIFSCVVPFKRKKKKIQDLSLPPCMFVPNFVLNLYVTVYKRFELHLDVSANKSPAYL